MEFAAERVLARFLNRHASDVALGDRAQHARAALQRGALHVMRDAANAAANAFGAQLAYPGRQTIALCGDGGFSMQCLGDLMTQVQRKTPVVQIVLNNASLDFVNIEMQEAGAVPFGVDFETPNFAKVAEAMGARGIRIEEPGDVREGLAVALAYKAGPVVVDVVVDRYALSLPAHVPFHTAEGFTLSIAKQVLNGKMDSVIKTIERNLDLV